MNSTKIRIGTRGSQLALYQANRVKYEIQSIYKDITAEVCIIKTKGDKILDTALSKIGDKGLFTKEIESALLANDVDIAVHSLKDLSTDMPEGLKLGAVLKRGEFRDALVHKEGKSLNDLSDDDIIATSSLRRIAGLRKMNPKIKVVDIRGNVNTRLSKMNNGYCDGMIMAAAGLQRLGLEEYITEILEPSTFIPAVAQGAIAMQSRESDPEIDNILSKLNSIETMNSVLAERKFLNTLQGGCQVPVGCYSEINGKEIILTGFVASIDGTNYLKESISGTVDNSVKLGSELANTLIELGGDKILEEIRNS
jgi:hydroxymethylbilane synthase